MDVCFLPVKAKVGVSLPKGFIDSLPSKVALFTSIQFYNDYDKVKEQLEASGREVFCLKTDHTSNPGQLLGCNIERFSGDFEAFLYFGDGVFHPKTLLYSNSLPVFVFNPFTFENGILPPSSVNNFFLPLFKRASNIGVILSSKPGQFDSRAFDLHKRFPDKNFYNLLCDNIPFKGLEDFSFINLFINTACPRIVFDNKKDFPAPVFNLSEVDGSS